MPRIPIHLGLAAGMAGAALAGCRHAVNYPDPAGPRFAAPPLEAPPMPSPALRVVTWNVQWGEGAETAAEALATEPELRAADFVMLQEMDEPAVRIIAARLGAGYVYYPAAIHPRHDRDFGNAILSRWPLTEDRKLILPRLARFTRAQRIAVVATALVDQRRIRVYALHLGTGLGIGEPGIRDQLRAVIRDAAASPDPVIVAGDLNSSTVGGLLLEAGFRWLTRRIGPTTRLSALDHVFVRGLPAGGDSAGVVRTPGLPSDHRPVWAALRLGEAGPPPPG